MNVFFITNLNIDGKGGLFYATYERIIRHKKKLDQTYVINNNVYHSPFAKYVRTKFRNGNKQDTPLPRKSNYKGIEINNLNYKIGIHYYIKKKIFRNHMEDILSQYKDKFDRYLKSTSIIHAHWGWPNGYLAYKLGKEYSVPYYITFHGSDINYLNERNKKNMLIAMENAEECFFVSNNLYHAATKLGYTGKNASIVYNGVDLSSFQIINREINKKKWVGFVGALEYKKGADLLTDIFKEINKQDQNVYFKIVGKGSLLSYLKEEFQINYPNINVEFTSEIPIEKVPIVMNQLDVLVIPSRNEGFGMVALEANACGTPVVGSNVGGLPESIEYSENIINMDESFIENIANRIIDVLNGDTLNKEELRERVIKKFDWNIIAEEEMKKYKIRNK